MLPTLKKGDIVTIIGISDWMATTTRNEVYATGEMHNDKPVFKDTSRSRKKYTLTIKPDQLVFINLPKDTLTLDSEAKTVNGMRSFSGNACFNFMETPEEIKQALTLNVNDTFNEHDRILSHATNPPQLAFPDQYTAGTHAIIDRLVTPTPTI